MAALFSETDKRPKNNIIRLPCEPGEVVYNIQQYDADFDKQKLYTVKIDYTKSVMNKPTKEELNALRDECFNIACDHGFHDEVHSERHFLCLVITELCEAVEADRKDRHADLKSFNQSVETDYVPIATAFEGYIKDSVEDELADAAIRILDLAGMNGDDLDLDHSRAGTVYYFTDHTFAESIYEIIEWTIIGGYEYGFSCLFMLADALGFDLMEHIRLKMQYNRTRERLHGKKY